MSVRTATPDWHVVAGDGSYAWHDHRAHWMNAFRPPGRRPGDRILESVIPLVVDGVPTSVRVASTWLPAPSPLPVWIGVVAGGAVGALAALSRRRRQPAR